MITTTDLADFRYTELIELEQVIIAYREHGLPDDFEQRGIKPMFNRNSGDVFLTNDEYQVAMINPDTGKLESFYSCPECAHEGFFNEFEHNDDNNECQEYIKQIKENREET